MIVEDLRTAHTVLVALYLRGAPRQGTIPRKSWSAVLRALRESGSDLGAASRTLRTHGLWIEASTLESPGLLDWAERHARHAVTPVCENYPAGWLRALGEAAPPAAWQRGDALATSADGPWLGAVGSRDIDASDAAIARAVGGAAVGLGYAIVSGGAEGCDTQAAFGARQAGGRDVRILPCGFHQSAPSPSFDLSVCAPDEPFSAANAMERNALIYAAAEATVVVRSRFRAGGTWRGATEALRRRLGRLLILDDGSPAHRALLALGGLPLSGPGSLSEALAQDPIQKALFSLA